MEMKTCSVQIKWMDSERNEIMGSKLKLESLSVNVRREAAVQRKPWGKCACV